MDLVQFLDMGVALLLKISQKLPHPVIVVWVVPEVYFLVQHLQVCQLCVGLVQQLVYFSILLLELPDLYVVLLLDHVQLILVFLLLMGHLLPQNVQLGLNETRILFGVIFLHESFVGLILEFLILLGQRLVLLGQGSDLIPQLDVLKMSIC